VRRFPRLLAGPYPSAFSRPTARCRSAALGLDVPDLDLASRQARARTKGGHARPLHFQTAAARLLARLVAGRQSGPVFLTARRAAAHRVMAADLDPASGRARLSYEMAGQLFKRHSGGKTLHQLRHSRLTHLGEANVSAPLLMAISGHKRLATLQRYVAPSQAAVAALMAASDPDRRGRLPDPSGHTSGTGPRRPTAAGRR
jgi:integrase